MKWLHSFRWRILSGAFFWTLGLVPAGYLVFLGVHYRSHLRIPLSSRAIAAALAFALICLLAGIWQIRAGLAPFGDLRKQLSRVRDGSGRRIEGAYPTEVQPLVNDLNALLEHRERSIRRALAKAGDLAHGLKNPLAVLAMEAERVEAAGQHETATTIAEQVERMRLQVEHHLAHARAAGSGDVPGSGCPVLPAVEGLTRTLGRIYASRGLQIDLRVSPGHAFRGQLEDLEEMLGNILDNAFKWAKSAIRIQSLRQDGRLLLVVEDDGTGLPRCLREAVLRRGVRADEAAPGSGLGLAIANDLAEVYGGTISLEDSPIGGLRVQLQLPAITNDPV